MPARQLNYKSLPFLYGYVNNYVHVSCMVLGRLTSKLAKEQHRKVGMMLLGAFAGASVLLFVSLGSMWIISDRIMEFIDEFVAVTHLAVDDLELYVNQPPDG